jgi:hypothetical protein
MEAAAARDNSKIMAEPGRPRAAFRRLESSAGARRRKEKVRIPGRTILTDSQLFHILEQRFFYQQTYARIAAETGISQTQVVFICQGKRHCERVKRWKDLNQERLMGGDRVMAIGSV